LVLTIRVILHTGLLVMESHILWIQVVYSLFPNGNCKTQDWRELVVSRSHRKRPIPVS